MVMDGLQWNSRRMLIEIQSTYQNPKNTSVIISAVMNRANTIQYIIHLTFETQERKAVRKAAINNNPSMVLFRSPAAAWGGA